MFNVWAVTIATIFISCQQLSCFNIDTYDFKAMTISKHTNHVSFGYALKVFKNSDDLTR